MMKKIFSIPGLIVLILILALAYIGFWIYLRSTVVSGLSNYISELESEGYQVEHGGLTVTGFPFAIDANSPNIAIRTTPNSPAAASSNWAVNTDELDMYSRTLSPLSWSIRHRGELGVDMRFHNGGERYMFDVTPANIDADFAYSLSGKLKNLHTDISRTQINPLLGAEPAVLGLAGLRADLEVKAGTGVVNILAKDIVMSEQALGVAHDIFGQSISRLSLKAEIENWETLEFEGVEVWLQSPAKIKSDDWQLLWGSADIVGSFDLGFKDNLPEGVIRFRVKNVDELLQSLTAVNLIDFGIATQLNTVVSSMDSDEDGRKSIEITIRDGVVKYGFFTLFRL